MSFETDQEVNRAVRAWVRAGPGSYPVIPGNEDAPTPNGLYCRVLLIDDDQYGTEHTEVREDGTELMELDVTARFSVVWYRDGALDAARNLRAWWNRYEGYEAARSRGLQVYDVSTVRRLDTTVAGRLEQRANMDIAVAYTYDASQNRDTARVVPVDIDHDFAGITELEVEADGS